MAATPSPSSSSSLANPRAALRTRARAAIDVGVDNAFAENADAASIVLGSPDLAGAITRHVEREDLLAWSLGCLEFRRAQVASGRKLVTPARAMMRSVALAEWAWPMIMMEPIMITGGWSEDRLPVRWAAEGGQVEVLEWLRDEQGRAITGRGVVQAAARAGQLETLKFLRGLGCEWDAECMWEAARRGHLEVAKWLRANGCPWSALSCAGAAGGGHLHVLQWLRDSGCPWHGEGVTNNAAAGGHVHVLEWAHNHGCPMGENSERCAAPAHALMGGQLDALEWLLEHGCEWDAGCSREAARCGQVEVLRWAAGRGLDIDGQVVMEAAAKYGKVEVLRWGQECGLPLGAYTLMVALHSAIAFGKGDIDLLRWAVDAGCTLDAEMCVAAAANHNPEALKYLRERGCPWDARTSAVARGELLEWVIDHGCPFGTRRLNWG